MFSLSAQFTPVKQPFFLVYLSLSFIAVGMQKSHQVTFLCVVFQGFRTSDQYRSILLNFLTVFPLICIKLFELIPTIHQLIFQQISVQKIKQYTHTILSVYQIQFLLITTFHFILHLLPSGRLNAIDRACYYLLNSVTTAQASFSSLHNS